MSLPLDKTLKIGVSTMYRRTEPAVGPGFPRIDEMVEVVSQVDRLGFNSFWVGDHISMEIPFLDPFQQLAQAAVISRRLTFGVGVYLLPLRHPAPVAKQAATMDLLTEGRFIFGVGVGGEFPKEYEACRCADQRARRAARREHRGAAQAVDRQSGDTRGALLPLQGRQDGAGPAATGRPAGLVRWTSGRRVESGRSHRRRLDLLCRLAGDVRQEHDGIRRPQRKRAAPSTVSAPRHLMFCRVGDSYEQALDRELASSLSVRYAMDMKPARALWGRRPPARCRREDPRLSRGRRPPHRARSRRPLREPRRPVRALRDASRPLLKDIM